MADANCHGDCYVDAEIEARDKHFSTPEVVNNRSVMSSPAAPDDRSEVSNGPPEPNESDLKNEILVVAITNRSSKRMENNNMDENKDVDEACGWGFIQLGCCQRFRTAKWFLLVFTICGACQGMFVNGFVSSVISTIERRFELSSTESGLISSSYDIMFALLIVPVSYFGGRGNKPRYIGIGMIVLGLGSLTFSLPHFLSGKYEVADAQETICLANRTSPTSCNSGHEGLSDYKYFFILGQLLHGAGATTIYTLGLVYIDESVPQRSSSLYNGIFYTGAVLGPALGYALSSQFLKIYTDTDVDPDKLGINVNNPKWVGAWWIGFALGGALAILLSLPMLAFPQALPGTKQYAIERGKERHEQKGVDTTGQYTSIRDILLSLKLLLSNLPFMLINIAAVTDGLLLSGLAAFLPKLVEYQFGLSSSKSALYIGIAVIPAGGGATFLGGFLVSFFKLKVKGILRMSTILTFILLGFILCLLLNCKSGDFAGVTSAYQSERQILRINGSFDDLKNELISSCNQNCNCQEEDYFPMCGRDGRLYFSPCYAGCTRIEEKGNDKFYYDCHCLDYNYTTDDSFIGQAYEGELGKCDHSCKWFAPFMVVLSGMIIVVCLIAIPSITATLRCVPDHQRSFALGIQWVFTRCLGSVPGPLLFGKMFDLACRLWQKRCNGSGSCFFYDNDEMRVNLITLSLALVVTTAISLLLACWFYKAVPTKDTDLVELKLSKNSVSQSSSPSHTAAPDAPTGPYMISQKSVFI